jgi:hypothetical protein
MYTCLLFRLIGAIKQKRNGLKSIQIFTGYIMASRRGILKKEGK